MTKEQLIEKYPSWFAAVKSSMAWGFSIGEGWMPMLADLCEQIAHANPPENFHFTQIKQKFGLARIYYRHGNEAIGELIDYFEEKSGLICERCASTENVDTAGHGWIVTLCESCRAA